MIQDVRRSWRILGWTIRFTFRPIWRWRHLIESDWCCTFETGMNGRCYCPEGWWSFWRTPLGCVWLDAENLAVGPCWCDFAIAAHFERCVQCYAEPCAGGWCAECLAEYGLTEAPHAA